jgi:hypothetical protein
MPTKEQIKAMRNKLNDLANYTDAEQSIIHENEKAKLAKKLGSAPAEAAAKAKSKTAGRRRRSKRRHTRRRH